MYRLPKIPTRDAALADIDAEITAICQRRGVQRKVEEIMRVPATPCAPAQRARAVVGRVARHGVRCMSCRPGPATTR